MKIKRVRKNLNKNKIFFETVFVFIASISAIYISFQANSIAENQGKIMEWENTPNLEIRKTQIYNDSLKIYDRTIWLVYNHNSKISNFDIEKDYSFLNFSFKNTTDSIRLPINNYINLGGRVYGTSEGLIYDFDDKYTGYSKYLLWNSLFDIGYLDIESYIKISYKTVLGKSEKKYFQILPSIKEIDSLNWSELERFHIKNNTETLYINNTTSNQLRIKLLKMRRKQ
ncbi:hypothetical protein [Flavobacterium suzhouense]|uniref:GLPGLI family protein n=1 Tax=Flavobacterium suzhouense TaxID=1529638 RepID=A0ABW5NXP1_9FLAO